MEKEKTVSTEELWNQLFAAPTIDGYFSVSGSEARMLPSFPDYISGLCAERKEKPEQVIRRGDIESSYGHRLFSGGRVPSRDTVLKLAFGFEMNADETQELLKVGRFAPLHPKVKRDAVIAYCLHRGKNITQTQQILYDYGLPLIGGKKNPNE